ncbi:unnamed protein product, partial [Trichogramma brassicae]
MKECRRRANALIKGHHKHQRDRQPRFPASARIKLSIDNIIFPRSFNFANADLSFSAQCPLSLCHSLCASASVPRRLQHLNNPRSCCTLSCGTSVLLRDCLCSGRGLWRSEGELHLRHSLASMFRGRLCAIDHVLDLRVLIHVRTYWRNAY